MTRLSDYVWLAAVAVVVGAPALCYQLLVRPQATIGWLRQGGGWPSPAEIEHKQRDR